MSAGGETAPAATVGGSGTDNYIPRWLGTNNLENSVIYQTDAGKVGIGTTNPQQALDLGSGTSGRAIVWGGPNGANWYDTIGASFSSSALSLLFMLKIDPAADRYLVSYTGNYPHTGIRILDGIHFFTKPFTSRSAGEVFDFALATRLFIKNDGNVGIGTTSPGAKLHVITSATGAGLKVDHDGDGQIAIQGISHDTVNPISGIGVLGISDNMGVEGIGGTIGVKGVASTSGGQAINGEASGGAYAGIFTGGNVGIGVTNPAYRLELPNNANASGQGRANAWQIYSSKKYKTNVETIDGAIEKVARLRGVYFDWKQNGKRDIGLIAEEVQQVIPEVVGCGEGSGEAESLDYGRLVALLVEAVKEQQVKINALEKALERQKSMEDRIAAMEAKIQFQANAREVQQ